MSFDLYFEEVPLVVSGVAFAAVSGRAEISSTGYVEGIFLENPWKPADRRLYLTGKSEDAFKNMLFELLSTSIKETCFGRIHDALVDYRHDNVASYGDWKRKNAAELA